MSYIDKMSSVSGDWGDLKKAHFYICGMPVVRLARSQLRPEQIWENVERKITLPAFYFPKITAI